MNSYSNEEIEELYRRCSYWIIPYGAKWGLSREDAEDLFQEAFFRAIDAYDSSRGNFETFLSFCLHNAALDHLKRARQAEISSSDSLFELGGADSQEVNPEFQARLRIVTEKIAEFLSRYAPNHAKQIWLRVLEFTWEDIDQITGAAPGVSRPNVMRKLKALQAGEESARVLRELLGELRDLHSLRTSTRGPWKPTKRKRASSKAGFPLIGVGEHDGQNI